MTFPVPPGYPAQGFAPPPGAPAPGYAPAPAPMTYAAPQPPQGPPPGYGAAPVGYGAPQPPQGAPAAFGPGAFAGATVTTPRLPQPQPGQYTFKIKSTKMRRERSSTFIAEFEIAATTNPNFPIGMTVSWVQFLHQSPHATAADILASDGGRIGIGQILSMLHNSVGFMQEMEFKSSCPTWAELLSAMFDEKQQLAGNPWPANPLAGRYIAAMVSDTGKKTKAKGQNPGGEALMRFDWRPAPAPAA